MKIVEIKIFRVDLPLAIPFLHFSSGQIDTLQEVVAAVSTDTDVVGYGEVRGNSPYLTGDTPDRAVAAASRFPASLHPLWCSQCTALKVSGT